MDIGSRVRDARGARGLTQAQLAYAAGLDPSTVSLLERGQTDPRIQTVRRLAEALRVRTEWLVFGLGPSETSSPAAVPSAASTAAGSLQISDGVDGGR